MKDIMKPVRIGLIGAGWVARQHLEVIRAIEGIEAVGITSRTRFKAEALTREFGIKGCYDTVRDLVGKASVDALMVLVNPDQMFSVGIEALSYGIPVFFEKPAGLTPEENFKLVELAENKKILTMVGFNRRYYSIYHKGMDIIRQHGALLGVFVEGHERMWKVKDLGKFSPEILAHWIFANSTHTIDLLRFFGGDAKNIHSVAHTCFQEARGDQFAAVMELSSGAIGQYQAHWYSPGGWRVVLYGEGVTVEFKPLEEGRWIDRSFVIHDIEPDELDKKYKPGFYAQMSAWRDLVETGTHFWPMLDLHGAYQTMRLAEKIST